jgi:hypothetical protein
MNKDSQHAKNTQHGYEGFEIPTSYEDAFRKWMETWAPHAFVTVNLPHERDKTRVPRDPMFYLNFWTRAAEAAVLGARTLKLSDYAVRLVWMFRREVALDGLIHYHGVVRFPLGRRWRDETPGHCNVGERCRQLAHALRRAASRTPEPFTPKSAPLAYVADIHVIPFDAAVRDHAGYMLKGMWRFVPDEWTAGEATYDSGLIILPHLPKKRRT